MWREVRGLIQLDKGVLVLDDTTLDKPYAFEIELVTYHWSGKHQRVVKGINLLTLLWTGGGGALIPCDFRVYDKPVGGKTKNEHFQEMLETARRRGFKPTYVLFDTWYASLKNLKAIRGYGWLWLTRLKSNRLVNLYGGEGNYFPLSTVAAEVPPQGIVLHLRGYGPVKVFRVVSLQKRGRGVLGNQRLSHGGGEACHLGEAGLGYRGLP